MFYIAQLIGLSSMFGGTNSTEGFDIYRLPRVKFEVLKSRMKLVSQINEGLHKSREGEDEGGMMRYII